MSEKQKKTMNIQALLTENGMDVYRGELGIIDYDIVELGKKSLHLGFSEIVLPMEDQCFVYQFYKSGFTIHRWVFRDEEVFGAGLEEKEKK